MEAGPQVLGAPSQRTVPFGPGVEVRIALHGAQVAREGGAAEGEQRRQALVEESGAPRLLIGNQCQRHAEARPGGRRSEHRRVHDEVLFEPALQGVFHADIPTQCLERRGQGRFDGTSTSDDVGPWRGEEGAVQESSVDTESFAEGGLPRTAPPALGIEEHAIDIEGQEVGRPVRRGSVRTHPVASTIPARHRDGPSCARRTSRGSNSPAVGAGHSAEKGRPAAGALWRRRRPRRT